MAKYCGRCGAPMQESDRFCPSCGQPASTSQSGQSSGQSQNIWSQPQNSWSQSQSSQPRDPWDRPKNSQPRDPWDQPPQTDWGAPQTNQPTMKWFKFIIWVQLFLSALGNLGTGLSLVTGLTYGEYASSVYYYFTGLKAVDIFCGLLTIALGIVAIYVRFQLSGFRRRGPDLYLYYLAANIVVSFLYIILTSVVIGTFAGDTTSIVSLIASAVLIAINSIYFKKRRHLFVN
ncbi:MAG: zinc ribbon domain-containing protein [Oscillospiraceae bacterium]|nr:zinc ribbon domain-containing protein [Oscillospiraceae bacterium]